MSAPVNDGGPAFPPPHPYQNPNGDWFYPEQPGMSLRDWFAGQALAGLAGMVASDGSDFLHTGGPRSAAQFAYTFADAMIAARVAK